ncbi:hypothetical protein [Pseudomonas sp. F(2018)]|uniref:hypothetical protein n=1 Tax=Pseudomonas sp. F(2018) TaxID=2502240 RepID=UPI0010F7C788|nr:hypothetical protein [Pseudomonas sp. F(2018)]
MQLHHDPSTDPQSVTAQDRERQRIAEATAAFLAGGGQIEQVGHQMQDANPAFVINPRKTPVYAHLFVQPETEPLRAKVQPVATVALAEAEIEVEQLQDEQPAQHQVVEKARCSGLSSAQLAARLMVQAKLGASPKVAAEAVGIPEKQARQLARDFRFTFPRQR